MREAAARAQCQNNLKQIILSLQNYEETHGELPCGTLVKPGLKPEERLSWMVTLLPYVEREELYKQFDQSRGWSAESNQRPSAVSVKTFICPAQVGHEQSASWPFSSYVGIAGVGADAASLPLADARCGVFGLQRRTTMNDVKDGTSYTLCMLETAQDNGHWAAGGTATVRPVDPQQQPYIGENRPFGIDHRQPVLGSIHFSRQPLLTNAVMLDGSVRILNASIDPRSLESLATIDGKEPIPDDF